MATPKKKQIIVSGAQPTGRMHVGNYAGAVRNWLDLQKKADAECYFFLADYHSISADYDPAEKRQQILDMATDLLALGLDPDKCVFFKQSDVAEHTELCWVFNTVTPVSFLERMTQYKDKAAHQAKNVNMGIFDYPVLQAADILIYKGEFVPVGVDQVQHVELTRDVARFYNNKFGAYFPETKPKLTDTPKILSLSDPLKKMSKSHGEKSCVYITDTPDEMLAKLKKAVTETTGVIPFDLATFDPAKLLEPFDDFGKFVDKNSTPDLSEEQRRGYAGVLNLKKLLEIFGSPEEAETLFSAQPVKYGELKSLVAERIADFFADFRKKRAELAKDPAEVRRILDRGAEKARAVAAKTMEDVRKTIGLR